MDMGYTLKVLLSQKNHSLKICVCIFQDVGSYEAPKSNKAGLRFSKWKVEIFNFFWHQNFFQNKSIGYEVTWLYRFWIFRQFIGFWKKVKFQKSPKPLKMAILPICGSQPRCSLANENYPYQNWQTSMITSHDYYYIWLETLLKIAVQIIGTTFTPGWDWFHNFQFYTKLIWYQVPKENLTFLNYIVPNWL